MRGKLSFTFGHAFAECKPSVRGSDTITPTSIQSSKSLALMALVVGIGYRGLL